MSLRHCTEALRIIGLRDVRTGVASHRDSPLSAASISTIASGSLHRGSAERRGRPAALGRVDAVGGPGRLAIRLRHAGGQNPPSGLRKLSGGSAGLPVWAVSHDSWLAGQRICPRGYDRLAEALLLDILDRRLRDLRSRIQMQVAAMTSDGVFIADYCGDVA